MGLIEQISRKQDDVKQLLEYAFPYATEKDGKIVLKEEDGVITVSDYTTEQAHNYYRLEILHAFLIERFVKDEHKKTIARNLKKKFYLIPISKDRKGRTEIFDTVKAKFQRELEQNIQHQQQQNLR